MAENTANASSKGGAYIGVMQVEQDAATKYSF